MSKGIQSFQFIFTGQQYIRITQIYARITNKKVECDMEELAGKLSKFNTAMGI